MKYLSVAQAKEMDGLRLVLTAQTPGIWGFAARALFDVKGVPYVPVRQEVLGANEDLVAWTGRRNAPIAVYNDEPGVDNWLEITHLADRLGGGPSLLPEDFSERAMATGISAAICGHDGLGWSRRVQLGSASQEDDDETPTALVLRDQYAVTKANAAHAEERSIRIIRGLAEQMHRQRERGSQWLVGDRIGACDIHWACFSNIMQPLPDEDIIMEPWMRVSFETLTDAQRDALDPILIEHRDRVWREHIGLPFDYLPDEA